MTDLTELDYDFLSKHTRLLSDSYQHLTGTVLHTDCNVKGLMDAPFALVSHGIQIDPVFNYANCLALKIFGYNWQQFTQLPSRASAEPILQEERARILAEVTQHGFIDHYSGVRVTKDGKHFQMKHAVVWNLIDENGEYYGQAAKFDCD